jgi:hypothetical protein
MTCEGQQCFPFNPLLSQNLIDLIACKGLLRFARNKTLSSTFCFIPSAAKEAVMANKTRPFSIGFRVNLEEQIQLNEFIEQSGLSQQEFILRSVLHKPIIQKDILENLKSLAFELNRQGNNLNQIAYQLNRHDLPAEKINVDYALQQLAKVWSSLNDFLSANKRRMKTMYKKEISEDGHS